jgi:isopentenyldiphosphate isomerase
MAVFSVMVGTSVQQRVQAQDRVPTQWETSCSAWTSSGIFSEYEGIEFTPEQDAARQRFSDEGNVKNGAIYRNSQYNPNLEQRAEIDANLREFEIQTLSILTPEQQQVYQENLVIKRALEACDPSRPGS